MAGPLRRTLQNEPAAEARIAQDLARLAAGVDSELGDSLRGLWLVNALARAEGSIVYEQGEPRAADPGYELLAVFSRKAERRQVALDAIARTWSRLLHTRVSIFALAVHDLGHLPASRFWFHVARGQLAVLAGAPTLPSAIHSLKGTLDAHEPAYALCEGFVGLALAQLDPGATPARRAGALQAAVLAVGDALLLDRGAYAETLPARLRALGDIGASAALRGLYREAIAYLPRPDTLDAEAPFWFESTQRSLAQIHLEAATQRHGTPRELLDYVRSERTLDALGLDPGRAARSRFATLVSTALLTQDAQRMALACLLRCSAGLAFAPTVPAIRGALAAALRIEASAASDAVLADELSALAGNLLGRNLRQPFPAWTGAAADLRARGDYGLVRRVRRRFGFVL